MCLCSLRPQSSGSGGDVSDVGPGPGHSGAVCPPSESPQLPLLPSQHPAWSLIPPGSSCCFLLPAGWSAFHPYWSTCSGDRAGWKKQNSWTLSARYRSVMSPEINWPLTLCIFMLKVSIHSQTLLVIFNSTESLNNKTNQNGLDINNGALHLIFCSSTASKPFL